MRNSFFIIVALIASFGVCLPGVYASEDTGLPILSSDTPIVAVANTVPIDEVLTAELRQEIANGTSGKRSRRDPSLAGVMSFIIPGTGQVYAGKSGRGALIFTGEFTLLAAGFAAGLHDFFSGNESSEPEIAFSAFIALHLWQTYDATRVASEYNARQRATPRIVLSVDSATGAIQVARMVTF